MSFLLFFVGVVSWLFAARAQTQAGLGQVADDAAGATVTRGKTVAAALKVSCLQE